MQTLNEAPIDLNLAITYGKCVEAAYKVYTAIQNDPGIQDPLNPPMSMYPDDIQRDYQLLFNIQMTDFAPFNETPRYYGFIAKALNAPYNYVVAIRGTEGWEEWYDDFDFFLTRFDGAPDGGYVASGFYTLFESLKLNSPTRGATDIRLKDAATDPSLTFDDSGNVPVVVAGHSLGAALSTMYAAYMANTGTNGKGLTVYTFASPKVGDRAFADMYNASVPNNYRIYNIPDLVPRLPINFIDPLDPFEQVSGGYPINSKDNDSIKRSIECYHSLLTYLFVIGDDRVQLGACRRGRS